MTDKGTHGVGPWAYVTGGTLAPDAPSYVERGADRDLLSHLESGETCYVLNSRQMGKSSLCVRTIGKLKEQGIRTAFCDLTKFGGRNVTPEQWYAALTAEVGRDLGLRAEFIAHFKENSALPPVQRLFGAIVEVGLIPDSPLVVFIDEIDATRSLSFSTDEFFAAIRECHNRRVQDPRYLRLSFCMLGVAVPSDLINIATSTPFNIGRRIALEDFTLDEAMALSTGLCSPTRSETAAQAVLKRVHEWTNGQPYLTQSLCSAIAGDETILTAADVDRLVHRDLLDPMARQTNINLADVANRAVHAGDLEPEPEKFRADMLSAYDRIWRGKPYADDEANRTAALLKLSGIVVAEGNKLRIRNLIYRKVFDRGWLRENMPGQEIRRQRRSFWKGVLRTSLVSAAVVCVVGYFAFLANKAQRTAEAAKKDLDYQVYVAKVNNLQSLYEEGNSSQFAKTLEETKDSPYRGWEWGYWNAIRQDSQEEYALDSSKQDSSHYALFSKDGLQIMIPDKTLGIAILIDRRTRRAVAHYPMEKNETIYRVGARWMAMSDSYENGTVTIRDLVTGELTFKQQMGEGESGWLRCDEESEIIIHDQQTTVGEGITKSSLRDPVTGKVLWELKGKRDVPQILDVAKGWERILITKISRGIGLRVEYQILDRKKRVLDRSESTNLKTFPTVSPSGRYWVHPSLDRLIVREVDRRRTILEIDLDQCTLAMIDPTDQFLVTTHADGRVMVRSIPEGQIVAKYRLCNSATISPSTMELILFSRTIRVVPLVTPKKSKLRGVVSRGFKNLLVFSASSTNSFEFRSDPGLALVGKPTKAGGAFLLSRDGRLKAVFENSGKVVWLCCVTQSLERNWRGQVQVGLTQQHP